MAELPSTFRWRSRRRSSWLRSAIAVVSDIHGNLPALQAVQDFQRRGVDGVINLGDSLSGPLLPQQTARYLMASGWLHLPATTNASC